MMTGTAWALELSIDKKETSYDDLLDGLRLSLAVHSKSASSIAAISVTTVWTAGDMLCRTGFISGSRWTIFFCFICSTRFRTAKRIL